MCVVVGKGEARARTLVLVVGHYRILQTACLTHNGHRTVAQGDELA